MKLLVCGGAGFIGSNFVRVRVRDHGDEVVVLDKLTYAGRRENLQDVEHELRPRRDRGPARGGRGDGRASTRWSTSPPRPTSTARSPSPTPSSARTPSGTYVLLEAARERGVRYLQVSTDEVYGSIEEGSFTEESPLAPSSPYSATKAGRRPARLQLPPHLRARDADLPRLEQLRALPVPGEADPADGPQRAARRQAARLRRRHAACATGSTSRTSRAASATCSSTACPARSTTSAAPTSARTSRSSSGSSSYTGAGEELIEYVTDRPGHDRRYSLGSEKVRALGWEAQVRFADGLERTVDWYRDNEWWWEPIRSGDYRAYYERQYGRALG